MALLADPGRPAASTSAAEVSTSIGSTPSTQLALPCGSRSTTNTRWPACQAAEASPRVTVVLPTPPFWFTNATGRAHAVIVARVGNRPRAPRDQAV